MKKMLFAFSCLILPSLCLATNCEINSEWNKYCTYNNGCYEYWNKSGVRYYHCAEDDSYNEINKYWLTDEAVARWASCNDFFPWTTLWELNYCNCPNWEGWNKDLKMCTPFTWEKVVPESSKREASFYEQILTYGWGILFIVITIYIIQENKNAKIRYIQEQKEEDRKDREFYAGKELEEAEEKEFLRIKPYDDRHDSVKSYDAYLENKSLFAHSSRNSISSSVHGNIPSQISLWHSSIDIDHQKILSPLISSLNTATSRTEILKMIDDYYETHLTHIYSSEDKIYKDLFSLKDYL